MLPFSQIVVLDFARGYPGAYTTMFLGDFGADVIRIDPPINQPNGRGTNPNELAAYETVQRNKRSIVIDLKSSEGHAVLGKLVKKADVLLEGFRPGVMTRLHADYETLKELNPRLIYCSLSGFGPDGPYAAVPAHDMNFISLGGILSLIGQRNGAPYLPSNFIADLGGAALHGLVGVLIALFARERTGKGQLVDIAYLDSAISFLAMEAPNYFRTGEVPRRGETGFTGRDPWINVYRCKDGEYVTVACFETHFWDNFCQAIGREDLMKYKREPYPIEELDRVTEELADIFITKTRDEWWQFFKNKEVCFGPVQYLNETFSDPQVLHREMVVEVDHPKVGKVKQLGLPIKLTDTPGKIKSLGVPSGANTGEILKELGYDDGEIVALLGSGVVTT